MRRDRKSRIRIQRKTVAACVAVCALIGLSLAVMHGCQSGGRSAPLNLVVILIDTLRADHLGCYGYDRATSPNIDRLAEGAILFENAVAPSSWTLPSTASILTALHPTRHQAVNRKTRLALHRDTLAEVLRRNGYHTGAVVSHILVSPEYNMDQGFEDFDDSSIGERTDVSSPAVTERGLQWLRSGARSPFFLMLHYFDPHGAYVRHPEFEFGEPYDGWLDLEHPSWGLHNIWRNRRDLDDRDRAHIVNRYDGEIAFVDHHVGRVLEEIRQLGLESSTIVVLTADHGEEFFEHGYLGHTEHLYEETIHVPLIIQNPALETAPARFAPPVAMVDLMPTLLEMLGVVWDGTGVDGRSCLGALLGHKPAHAVAYSEVHFRPIAMVEAQREIRRTGKTGAYHDLRSLRKGDLKLVYDVPRDSLEAYDLAADPAESVNLAGEHLPPRINDMKTDLLNRITNIERVALLESADTDSIAGMSPEAEERLRALGYIH